MAPSLLTEPAGSRRSLHAAACMDVARVGAEAVRAGRPLRDQSWRPVLGVPSEGSEQMQRSTIDRVEPPGPPPALDMVWVPGGTFRMGSADFYPEERPVVEMTVSGFWMDDHPVTVGEFRRFVKATGHVTVAERPPDVADYPDADPALLI